MDQEAYFGRLYPLQDEVLAAFSRAETQFYLTGGFVVHTEDLGLKVELVNDVPSRVGVATPHAVLGLLDSAENILANKLTALADRREPKDLADIWGFCAKMGLSIENAIEGARGKAAGLFPVDLARVLLSATPADHSLVRWIEAPPVTAFLGSLRKLGEGLLLLADPA